MSTHVERHHDNGAPAAIVAFALILAVAAVLLLGYFLYYAPRQAVAPAPDVDVTVPQTRPDVDVNVPPPTGGTTEERETSPRGGEQGGM